MKETEEIRRSANITEIYVFDTDNPKDRAKTYKINSKNKEIIFYPREGFFISEVKITGFEKLPKEFALKGYAKGGAAYYLDKKLKDQKVLSVEIAKDAKSHFKKQGDAYRVVINYAQFAEICKSLSSLIYDSKIEKSHFVDDAFHELYPDRFQASGISWRNSARKVIDNLNPKIIPHITNDESETLFNFLEVFLNERYKSDDAKRKLFRFAKIKIDNIAITQIISEFKKLLENKTSESQWGKHLERNLFLIDSKYIKIIPELNVMLAGARKVDFCLVDSQGYMDIFEIKKPTTRLLAKTVDRGNHYWSTDAIKALVQAEKYLHNTERKAPALVEDIKRERGVSVHVIKPRAFVIMGSRSELNTESKRNDFRVLRDSLKNVQVILYDELLERIENQKTKIYAVD